VHLRATGNDGASGVARFEWRLDAAAGWALDAPSGDGSSVTLHRDPAAGDATIAVVAVDLGGRRGPERTVPLLADATPPTVEGWAGPKSDSVEEVGELPSLVWRRVTDSGSGGGLLQRLSRESAPVGADGSCAGVGWASDGAPFLGALHHEDLEVVSGRCYRWTIRPLDRVGNEGAPVVSGAVYVDVLPPVADFSEPDEGTITTIGGTGVLVAWTESERTGVDPTIRRLLERERTDLVGGSCDDAGWRLDGDPLRVPSPASVEGLRPGSCYRWRANLVDALGNPSAWLSGTVVLPPA
jgi:hypothetical protein